MQVNIMNEDTICAIATAHGMGAIAVIRISGSHAFPIVAQLFQQNGKAFDMDKMLSHKVYFGQIVDGDEMLDEVLVTFFKEAFCRSKDTKHFHFLPIISTFGLESGELQT